MRGHVAELRSVLERLAPEPINQDVLPMMLWSSLVGSVAALHTAHKHFFVQTLRDAAVKAHALSLLDILDVGRQFVWSDSAGEQGAAAVCELAGIDTCG